MNSRIQRPYDNSREHVYNGTIILRPEPKPSPFSIEAELTMPSTWRGWGWPETVLVKWSDDGVDYRIRGKMTDDGPVLTEIHITGADLRPDHIRAPLNGIMRSAFAEAALGPRRDGGYTRRAGLRLRVPVGIGRPVDVTSARQRLDEVARIYKETPRGKKGQAVAEHFDISVGYARTLISEARKKGYLDETSGTEDTD